MKNIKHTENSYRQLTLREQNLYSARKDFLQSKKVGAMLQCFQDLHKAQISHIIS